jgi:hypothetical protein
MGEYTCDQDSTAKVSGPAACAIEIGGARGVIDTVNNTVNMTVVSQDENDLRAEYMAGVVQGRLQGTTVISARDNTWDNAYLTDPDHGFPKQPGPSSSELLKAQDLLRRNYDYFLGYLRAPLTAPLVAVRLKRLLFRMLGIYHGASGRDPEKLDFSGGWLPDRAYLGESELTLNYETKTLSFLDVYLLNAFNDLMDVQSSPPEITANGVRSCERPDQCSAFVTRCGSEILITHNSWMGFLSQTMCQTIVVNKDWQTINAATPGLIGSGTDFGYNNKGIMFNETTHRMSKVRTKVDGLWIFWRAALAEQFSASISDFYEALTLDNTGTYLNGYMVVDAKTNETCLIEMSYRCFVYHHSRGSEVVSGFKCLDSEPCRTDFDADMVTSHAFMGINFPASLQVREDLQSTDNRPARRRQFGQLLPDVNDIESAKRTITYTDDPANPLSIFGRWDLGYGETSYPKLIPDGSVDAKVASTSMALAFMKLSGELDDSSKQTGFWMLYGTPHVGGKPFIWSQSNWHWQKLRDVPDRVDGRFTLMPIFLK